MSALVLLAHGSALSPQSSRPARACARSIAQMGLFEQVRLGFYREAPSIRDVLGPVSVDPVYVVPFFMSQGHFTQTVIPAELAAGARDRPVVMCDPVGTSATVTEILLERVAMAPLRPEASALVLVGHGTPKNPSSTAAVRAHAEAVRAQRLFERVVTVFTDDEPRIEAAVSLCGGLNVVVVPMMTSEGYHTSATIPEAFAGAGGREVWIAEAVGTSPRMVDVILERVREKAAAPLPTPGSVAPVPLSGLAEFAARLDEVGRALGPLLVWRGDDGFWACRDGERGAAQLAAHSPQTLEEVVRFDSDGRYRVLSAAAQLPGGWVCGPLRITELQQVLEATCPAVFSGMSALS